MTSTVWDETGPSGATILSSTAQDLVILKQQRYHSGRIFVIARERLR